MPISVAEQLRYGSLGTVVALGGIPLYLYAPDFYAASRGVDLALIGSLLLVLRLLDGFTDPLWGWVSDRWPDHRFALFLLFGLFFLAGMWALFSPADWAGIGWFFVAVFVASAGYSYLTILLNSMASLRARTEAEAVSLTTVRESCVLIGLMLAALAPPALAAWLGTEAGYRTFVMSFVLVGLVLMAYWGGWLQHQVPTDIKSNFNRQALGGFLPVLQAGRSTYFLYAISALASACPAVLFVFFVRDYLQAEAWTGLYLFIYFVAGIAGMPLWRQVSRRVGMDRAWLLSMLFAVVAFSLVLLVKPGGLLLFALVCITSGIAFGGDLAMPSARLVGDLAKQRLQQDSSRAFALLAFISKLVLAIAAALLLWMLDAAGFQPAVENSEKQLAVLMLGYGGIPIMLKIVAALLLFTHLKPTGANADENVVWKNSDSLDTGYDR